MPPSSSRTMTLLACASLLGGMLGHAPATLAQASEQQMSRLVTLSKRNYTDATAPEGNATLESLNASPPSANPPLLVESATYGNYLYWTGYDAVIDPNDTNWSNLPSNSRTRIGPAFLRLPVTPAKFQKSVITKEIFGIATARAVLRTQAIARANGDLVAGVTMENRADGETWSLQNTTPRLARTARLPDEFGNTLITSGALVRTDTDGTNASLITSTLNQVHFPYGRLAQATDGTLYGMDEGADGNGRIYRLSPQNTLSTVLSFPARADGQAQWLNDILLASDGWLYGLLAHGRGMPGTPAALTAADTQTGVLFKVHPDLAGSYAVLHTFTLAQGEFSIEPPDSWQIRADGGGQPFSLSDTGMNTLAEGPDGRIYGTSSISACNVYASASYWVYRPATRTDEQVTGKVFTPSLLCGATKGSRPLTTGGGGYPKWDFPDQGNRYDVTYNSQGTIFRIGKDGSGFQTLHRFSGDQGATPRGPITFIGNSLFGTTLSGGESHHYYDNDAVPVGWKRGGMPADRTEDDLAHRVSDGILYALDMDRWEQDPAGAFRVLHAFSQGSTGRMPTGVTRGTDGALYGSTRHGGEERWFGNFQGNMAEYAYSDSGTIWRFGDDLGASINLNVFPASIKRGEIARLTWTATGVVPGSCTATSKGNDWQGPQVEDGAIDLTKTESGIYNYSLSCVNAKTGTPVGSNLATLRVDSPASETDGNSIRYTGGGGGGGLWHLLPLLPLAALAQRRRLKATRVA